MPRVTSAILKKLTLSNTSSHKGQNGRILVIAGSNTYHGALLLTIMAASRVVDIVYVHSVPQNLRLIQKLRSEIATFIAVSKKELWKTVELCDAVIVGPGLAESAETVRLVKKLLTAYPNKKTVVDATALWHVDPKLLHKNCIATPHSREFANTFKEKPDGANVLSVAKKYGCIVVLKGPIDFISDGKKLYENKTGNVGMTKGGTGDVLSGLIGALAATNDPLTAALAGAYLNGSAGGRLLKKVGTFYNAEDLMLELGRLWKK